MFNTMELRLIKHSIKEAMKNLNKILKVLDPNSDEASDISNDLLNYQQILDKIEECPDL
ncbi:MAG: hypothetical protein GY714_07560 [Desulfobacterales bacterium]|nr:hypothetical protein [Desulfobacterales bacterium]MCP4161380.1 hypothetical protein [Deltaproteobacteria bacterium]